MMLKPKSAALHITSHCTHKCGFCYASSGERNFKNGDISTLFAIVDKLQEAGVETICLLGGDPAKHPNIIQLLEHIKSSTQLSISLMSNTFDTICENGHKLYDLIDIAEATVHGACSKEHDITCGVTGAYDNLMCKFKSFSRRGIKIGIAINLTPNTCFGIYDIVRNIIEKIGIKPAYVIVQRIISHGRAKGRSEFSLTSEQANGALEQIDAISTLLGVKIFVEDPFPLCVIDPKYHKYMNRCEWGITKFALNSDGSFSRCGAVHMAIDNILEKNLLDIWLENQELLNFRKLSFLDPKCVSCELKEICGGGCPLSCGTYSLGKDYMLNEMQ